MNLYTNLSLKIREIILPIGVVPKEGDKTDVINIKSYYRLYKSELDDSDWYELISNKFWLICVDLQHSPSI